MTQKHEPIEIAMCILSCKLLILMHLRRLSYGLFWPGRPYGGLRGFLSGAFRSGRIAPNTYDLQTVCPGLVGDPKHEEETDNQ